MTWQPIAAVPDDAPFVLLRGGRPDNYSDEADFGDQPHPVVAWREGEDWRYCRYDGGYYGLYLEPTEWHPVPC